MRNHQFALTIGALLAALLLAACGSDDSDGDTVSKSDFVSQVDATCKEEQEEITAVAESDLEASIARSVEALEAEAERMESIGAPEGDEQEIDAILANVRKVIAMMEDDPSKVSRAINRIMAKAEKLADDYGLENCLLLPG